MDLESLFCTSCEKKGHVSKICQVTQFRNKKAGKNFRKKVNQAEDAEEKVEQTAKVKTENEKMHYVSGVENEEFKDFSDEDSYVAKHHFFT